MTMTIENPTKDELEINRNHFTEKEGLLVWKFLNKIESLDSEFNLDLLRKELSLICAELERMYATFEYYNVDLSFIKMKAESLLND